MRVRQLLGRRIRLDVLGGTHQSSSEIASTLAEQLSDGTIRQAAKRSSQSHRRQCLRVTQFA